MQTTCFQSRVRGGAATNARILFLLFPHGRSLQPSISHSIALLFQFISQSPLSVCVCAFEKCFFYIRKQKESWIVATIFRYVSFALLFSLLRHFFCFLLLLLLLLLSSSSFLINPISATTWEKIDSSEEKTDIVVYSRATHWCRTFMDFNCGI